MAKTNKELYINKEMSYRLYYADMMIPYSDVVDICKKVNRQHRDKTTSNKIKDHIKIINDEFMTYRDALEYIFDFVTHFKGLEPSYYN